MHPVSDRWEPEAKHSHTQISKLVAVRGDSVSGLPILSGSVTGDYDQTSRWSLTGEVLDEDGIFDDMERLLDPFIVTLQPSRGFVYDDGTEELAALGHHFVTELHVVDQGGPVWALTAFDASVRCQQNLADPFYIANGTAVNTAVARLLLKQFPTMSFRLPTTQWVTPTQLLREDSDPWAVARTLEQASGFELAMARDGVCAADPRVVSTKSPSVWSYIEGVNADFWNVERDVRNDAYPNVVKVIGTNPAAPGVSAIAEDRDPNSATYVGGAYGRHVRVFRSEKVLSIGQAGQMAGLMLARLLGPQDETKFSTTVNAALDPGDVIDITRERMGLDKSKMIVTRVDTPLTFEGEMIVTARRGVFTDVDGLPPRV